MSFQKKIFIGYLCIFFFLQAIIFPLAPIGVQFLAKKALKQEAERLLPEIQKAQSQQELIEKLNAAEKIRLFRLAILNSKGETLYDSHRKEPIEVVKIHPEVANAFKNGWGYHEEHSNALEQDLVYVATSFFLNQELLVLRLAFPLSQLHTIVRWFEVGLLLISSAILAIFAIATSLSTIRIIKPIRKIISLIRPYYKGDTEELAELPVDSIIAKDEFDELAITLNLLSQKIRGQIQTLQKERNQRTAILDVLSEGVLAVDKDLTINFANISTLNLLGKLRHQVEGQPFESLEERECEKIILEAYKKQTTVHEMLCLQSSALGPQSRFFYLSAVPLIENEGVVLILNDQTEQNQVVQLHKNFIANASHELKTPITIIQGFAETLHDQKDLSPEKIQLITAKILKHTERISMLISRLLMLTNMEDRSLVKLLKVNLLELIENCRNQAAFSHPTAQIILYPQEGEEFIISGEKDLLEIAFNNLIENGIKFSAPPAKIEIFLRKEPQLKRVSIIIVDHGIGIPEEDISHIFERFYRVERLKMPKNEGAGLGLSIVQTIIQKHNGTIEVESTIEKGTTFTLHFYYI